jgi:Ras-related GTP-binding protein A/B
MDLVQSRLRQQLFDERAEYIRQASEGFRDTVEFFPTSIWDQSLYKAWTQIIYFLIPNARGIEGLLRQLAEVVDARELILYERTTCLMVTHVTRGVEGQNPFTDRFERISSILKTHKQSMAYVLFPNPLVDSPANQDITVNTQVFPRAPPISPKCKSRQAASCSSSHG